MKLYVGGAFQGQEELARRENPGSVLLTDFHETVREALDRGEDGAAVAERVLREHPDAVVVANEIGAGIVPWKAEDRAWRENAGRAMCILAQASEEVTRVVCGIGMRIKQSGQPPAGEAVCGFCRLPVRADRSEFLPARDREG